KGPDAHDHQREIARAGRAIRLQHRVCTVLTCACVLIASDENHLRADPKVHISGTKVTFCGPKEQFCSHSGYLACNRVIAEAPGSEHSSLDDRSCILMHCSFDNLK